jgi:carbonic anhydrase
LLDNILVFDKDLTYLQPSYTSFSDGYAVNNGHAIQVNVPVGSTLVGGALSGTYNVLQFHFHAASEHRVNGGSYPVELHIVHQNADYLHQASTDPLELAAVGLMIQECDEENAVLKPLTDLLKAGYLMEKDDNATVSFVDLETLVGDTESYYTYPGSLTTPDCRETVTWHVLRRSICASGEQVQLLRTPFGLLGNGRPVLPIGNRTVRTNFDLSSDLSAARPASTLSILSLILAMASVIVASLTSHF